MKIQLVSVSPDKLVKDKMYLCGQASLVDEIEWRICWFDGKQLLINGVALPYPPKSDFFPFRYCLDGYTQDWLIFELPDDGIPGDLYKSLLSVTSPSGEKAMLQPTIS